jgi:hypothetical protein
MSRRPLIALLLCALALLMAGAPAQAARRTCHTPRGKVVHYSGAKRPKACVAVKHRKAKAKATPNAPGTAPSGPPSAGSSISMVVRTGSNVTLDLGGGRIRTFPLEGVLHGYLDGHYRPGTDTTFTFTRGALSVGATDTLMDDCPYPALARTNPATAVSLDPSRQSPMTITAAGAVLFKINMIVHVVLELRGDAGCGGTPVISGYSDTPGTVPVGGQVDGALSPFTLSSNRFPLRLNVCYVPGTAASPCQFAPTGLLSVGSVQLDVDVDVD